MSAVDMKQGPDLFAERRAELEAMAEKTGKPVARFPYLMEKKSGHIHPYTPALAEHSDLVVGCYNLEGSQDPNDADPTYDPQGGHGSAASRKRRIESTPPQSVAELKAAKVAMEKELRAELEAKLRAEYEAKYAVDTVTEIGVVEDKPKDMPKSKSKSKSKAKSKSDTVSKDDMVIEPKVDNTVPDEPVEVSGANEITDLEAEFAKALE